MPTTDQIIESIDARLVAADVEIRRLQAAQRALRPEAAPIDRPPRRARRAPTAKAVLTAEQVESLLSGDGSSAADLETRLGAERARILAMLRELEAGGRVRRSGRRRTTLWHAVTDEDRVAARAAELAAR
jgi:hypothetical protein